jgi:3',5'-cyclic AMP phosphodiesterase CpdA
MIGGDLVDDPNAEDQIGEFLDITSGIDKGIMVRWVPGNHDIADDFTAPTADSIRAYRDVFGPDHYSFRMNDTLFIALNTPVIDHPEHVPNEWESQLAFLTDELAHAGRSSLDHVIVVGHHPLFLAEPDEPDTYWNLPVERRAVILDLFHGAGVRIGFAGHWHRNAIASDGPFTQVTSGPVGYPLGDDPSGYRVVEVTPSSVTHEYRALESTQ